MILSFSLSMPNVGSWNGKWSGENKKYVIVKTFRAKKDIIKAEELAKKGYFHYSWPDGWGAGITVRQISSIKARQLRKESQGFCGYNWMVDTILKYGKPMADHEVKVFPQKQRTNKGTS